VSVEGKVGRIIPRGKNQGKMDRMKILHFSTNDHLGGAAKASYRLHRALREAGHSSRMLVRHKQSDDEDVREVPLSRWRSGFRRIFYRTYPFKKWLVPKPSYTFNLDVQPAIDTRHFHGVGPGDADVICLHWITDFLGVEDIRKTHDHFRRPLLWILMDIEPVTGGCHYSFSCDRFTGMCGKCPLLGSDRERDWSRSTWHRKRRCLQGLPITFVAPTGWVERRIRESSLFSGHPVVRIPLAIDVSVFRPVDHKTARESLGVPMGKKMIFFGSASMTDPRKGMSYLSDALRELAHRTREPGSRLKTEDILLLIAGKEGADIFHSLPFPRRELGYLEGDERLALAYQAADLFVCPSTEDAGPMMIPESMLCGTPVVAFDSGGAPDLIRSLETGYLAKHKDSADLANGILVLLGSGNLPGIRESAKETAVRLHAPQVIAGRYRTLFREITGKSE
jgi:glycosyltransferase involved in cell wall biosynthesis